ncbi:MAG: hypothetical protein ABI461_14750, partial [Polyangiaceae bacterium]
RVAWLLDLFAQEPAESLAVALDEIAAGAEAGIVEARDALIGIVDALNAANSAAIVQRLREEAAGRSLVALDRLLRVPATPPRTSIAPPERVAETKDGRPLTLGERKAMARRPDPRMLARLLTDPNPEVVRRLLENPRLTEQDVVRLVARRPARPEILAVVARSPRWIHRPNVRVALLLNPDAPPDIVAPITSLLIRQELEKIVAAAPVHPIVRALCLERLARRPPFDPPNGPDVQH